MSYLNYYISLHIFIISIVSSAKILTVFPASGYSQFILCEKLIQELVYRGHEVTVISLYEAKDPRNYTSIHLGDVLDSFLKEDGSEKISTRNIFSEIIFTYNFGYNLTERLLKHKKVQDLIHSEAHFDLILIEQFFNEAHKAFASHFNAPFVLFSSIGLSEWNQHLVGNINFPTIEPVSFSSFTTAMTTFQRFQNSVFRVFQYLFNELFMLPKHQELIDKYFPKKIDLQTIIYNASLLLLNSDPSVGEPFQSNHATVEIGSFHISENKLPPHIQTFLDDAEHGAILFNLGTNLKSTDLDKKQLEDIFDVFRTLKQKVLWKFENPNVEVPNNVLISTWLPQSDILAHPNTVLFITHGGLLSTTESIFYGVPMIGIPIFGDQHMNVARSVQNGVAVKLSLEDLNKNTLQSAIIGVIENNTFYENCLKRSNILREKPLRPIDLAIYWIDHVIKNKGASYLKSRTLALSWFQIYLIDIFVALAIAGMIPILILSILILRKNKCNTTKHMSNLPKSKKQKLKKNKKE